MEKIKEKIGYYKILVPLVWTGIFLMSSGTSWLVKNSFPYKKLIVPLMIFFIIILVISLAFLDKRIRKLIKEL